MASCFPVTFLQLFGRSTMLSNTMSWPAAHQLEVINQQHPLEPLQYLPQTLRLPFAEGIAMLHEAGFEDVRIPVVMLRKPACW